MKKMIIGAVAVLAAVSVNAAAITWQSGVVFGPSDAAGTLVASSGYKLADSSTASMYVFLIENATAYAKVQSDGVWATYGDKLGTADATTSTLSSSKFADLTTSGHSAGDNVYAAILFTYNDGSKDWYLENTAAITVNDLGANESLSNLARYVGGNKTSGQLASWGSQAVPEPTSGLLMLVGLAGLALRRKRA